MHCPSLNIFGTFFPSWMLCALIGLIVAAVTYKLTKVLRWDVYLQPLILFFSSIAISVTAIVWLTFYGQ